MEQKGEIWCLNIFITYFRNDFNILRNVNIF